MARWVCPCSIGIAESRKAYHEKVLAEGRLVRYEDERPIEVEPKTLEDIRKEDKAIAQVFKRI